MSVASTASLRRRSYLLLAGSALAFALGLAYLFGGLVPLNSPTEDDSCLKQVSPLISTSPPDLRGSMLTLAAPFDSSDRRCTSSCRTSTTSTLSLCSSPSSPSTFARLARPLLFLDLDAGCAHRLLLFFSAVIANWISWEFFRYA